MNSLERALISIVALHGNVADANDAQLIRSAVRLLCERVGPAKVGEVVKEWMLEQQEKKT